MELLPAVETLQWLAEHGPGHPGRRADRASRARQHPVKRGRWTYEPLGVVGVLGPAAEPFATPLGDVAVALMAGNGVVLKPSPHARAVRRADRARLRPRRAARGPAAGRPRPHRRGRRARRRRRWPRSASRARRAPGARSARRARAASSARCSSSAARTRCSCSPTPTSPRAVARRRVGGVRQRGPVRRLASSARCACPRSHERFLAGVVAGGARAARRRPGRPGDVDRPARRARARRRACARWSTRPSAPARRCTAAARVTGDGATTRPPCSPA